MFRVIERDATLSARVAAAIERLIVESRLPHGDRLPSERELGERFGVSRTVIREAVQSLAAKGLVRVRTGDGTYVEDRSQSNASEALSRLLRLAGAAVTSLAPSPRASEEKKSPDASAFSKAHAVYEVRRSLEIAIAGLAAARATPEDVEVLRRWFEAARPKDLEETRFVEADVQFHQTLAAATHNQLFAALLGSVSDLMNAIRELGVSVDGAREEGCRHHQRILEHVAARDVEGARQAMSDHLDSSERILDRAIARLARERRPGRQ